MPYNAYAIYCICRIIHMPYSAYAVSYVCQLCYHYQHYYHTGNHHTSSFNLAHSVLCACPALPRVLPDWSVAEEV